jgi:hypothetical protein
MPHGKTEEMILFSRSLRYYPEPVKEKKERDRTLNGKARVKARKAKQRAARV